jgi:hypothetical protein
VKAINPHIYEKKNKPGFHRFGQQSGKPGFADPAGL